MTAPDTTPGTEPETKLARIRAFAEGAPMARWLGFSAALEDGDILYRLAFDERHIGNVMIRAMHGGAIAAFLEFAAQSALAAELDETAPQRTIGSDIDYLASAGAVDLFARVTLTRVGRRMAFVEAVGWQEDEARPVAAARFRFRLGVDDD